MNNYINNYCVKTSIKRLRATEIEDWIDEMKRSYKRVHSGTLSKSQIAAWEDEFGVIKEMLLEFPERFDKTRILFEYVMPMKRPDSEDEDNGTVRPDVLLLSNDTIVILEFKQKNDFNNYDAKQIRKYKKRLQKWHIQSKGMNKKAFLVLTKAEGLCEQQYKFKACSPDRLAGEIMDALGEKPETMKKSRLKEWINSEYVVREKHKN